MDFPAADRHNTTDHISSLVRSFALVPPPAAPAIVDCVLASSPSLSASLLFSSLLDALPAVLQDWSRGGQSNSGSMQTKLFVSFANALFHLVKNSEIGPSGLESLVDRGVIPLFHAMTPDDKEILAQVVELLTEIVLYFKNWVLMEETIVPLCLRSIGLCIGMVQSGEEAIFHWNKESKSSHYRKYGLDHSFSLHLQISCLILTSLADAALGEKFQWEAQGEEQLESVGECGSSKGFACKLTWDLCCMVTVMLSQCSKHRLCAVHFLLPAIFRAFTVCPSFTVRIQGCSRVISWHCFSRRIWKCCLNLFRVGPLERQDAYNILSLHFSFQINNKVNKFVTSDQFDLTSEKDFWDEIRTGLVHKDASARKLSLYVLKLSLENQNLSPSCDDSEFTYSGLNCRIKAGPVNVSNGKIDSTRVPRREKWASMEAKSLGVGDIHDFSVNWNGWQRWRAFLLLYEMLEEYGSHLVEAAWTHLVYLLLQSRPSAIHADCVNEGMAQYRMETEGEMLSWLTILWERGFVHDNPQVRCLIMQSFLSIDWETYGNLAKLVPVKFILGPLIQALNDVVHHKDFGSRGTYTSRTMMDASRFFHQSLGHFPKSVRLEFLCYLASVARQESFGRVGLMALAFCISAACGKSTCNENSADYQENICNNVGNAQSAQGSCSNYTAQNLLDSLGMVVERCKHHFNPKYRLQVCEQVLSAACFVDVHEVPLDVLLHFVSTIPREFTDFGGPLRSKVQEWLSKSGKNGAVDSDNSEGVVRNLCCFPDTFVVHQHFSHHSLSFDDDDINAWLLETQRWARALFLIITRAHHLEQIFMFLKNFGTNICSYDANLASSPVKFLILIIGLIEELQYSVKKSSCCAKITQKSLGAVGILGQLSSQAVCNVYEKFLTAFLSISEELMQFAKLTCNIFWSNPVHDDGKLPSSIKGRLGGPSQRRLSSSTTTFVLQAIISIKCIAGVFSWFTWIAEKHCYNYKSIFIFLLKFSSMVILSPCYHTESGSEIRLAAYEALVSVFTALSSALSPLGCSILRDYNKSLYPTEEGKPLLDHLLLDFLRRITDLLENGLLTRSRRAVLLNWKWLCLDSLLSMPYAVSDNGVTLYSDSSLRSTLLDIIESLENASEASVLPMLRSVRLIFGIFEAGGMTSVLTSLNTQIIKQLVQSSWILHVNCNKRRVAPIAALLSSILHPLLFGDPIMHEAGDGEKGPLKWFIELLLDEARKSPRTIRLAACHLTGLWFCCPGIIKYYIKELKLFTLHGSVAFDEDFEAELTENLEARTEVKMLAQGPYSEFSEAYINTDMYARVSVAILFYNLSEMEIKEKEEKSNANAISARQAGRMFLLELLDSAVNDKDLAKELYKKFSAVHRRKVRAWQMMCILSRFVEDDIVQQVTSMVHTCLYRGNLSSVRQYIETFSFQIYLKFPALIKQQLIPVFHDYNMRPQALSSYVFIAANVIIHAGEVPLQWSHLNELLPPIIPLLTSHHHSLRGFTQVLIHHVLSKLVPIMNPNQSDAVPLEKRCFDNLRTYLAENADCVRLRASMETYFDSFHPKMFDTPAGIFSARDEASEFECVPVSLMDQVVSFLNDVRENLRYSMAKDTARIENEFLQANDVSTKIEMSQDELSESVTLENNRTLAMNFQKKITFHEHEKRQLVPISDCYSGIFDLERSHLGNEREDLLLSQLVQSRFSELEKLRESRQQIILVASLLDRIPNLAGLARTCEIFKATGLAVADASIQQDKQFQLISVTAEKWVPIIEVPVCSMKAFFEKKKCEGFSIVGLEQTANSNPLDRYSFPSKTVLVLGREKEGIPVDIIHALDACIEIPQLGIIRSLNVHVSGAIALWEYTRQQRCKSP